METNNQHDRIRQRGIITRPLKGNKFQVGLEDNPAHSVQATLSGKMMKHRITLVAGDTVTLELSPYDLTRGRIIYRHPPQ